MSKAPTSHRIHVILPAATYNKLVAERERTGAKLSELIRRACDAKYAQRPAKDKP